LNPFDCHAGFSPLASVSFSRCLPPKFFFLALPFCLPVVCCLLVLYINALRHEWLYSFFLLVRFLGRPPFSLVISDLPFPRRVSRNLVPPFSLPGGPRGFCRPRPRSRPGRLSIHRFLGLFFLVAGFFFNDFSIFSKPFFSCIDVWTSPTFPPGFSPAFPSPLFLRFIPTLHPFPLPPLTPGFLHRLFWTEGFPFPMVFCRFCAVTLFH